MKKSILFFGIILTSFSLMAFAVINWNDSTGDNNKVSNRNLVSLDDIFPTFIDDLPVVDINYSVESRFMNTVSKERLHNAKSILDILPDSSTDFIESFDLVIVSLLEEDQQINEIGKTELLTSSQKELLQSTDYANNIIVKAYYKTKSEKQIIDEENYLQYYMTIVPEKEASFAPGKDALINYLKQNSREVTAHLQQNKLRGGQIQFTVTKKGTLANIKLEFSSGYPSLDKKMLELISSVPGIWIPATNSIGEKVEQQLVFFFGTRGC